MIRQHPQTVSDFIEEVGANGSVSVEGGRTRWQRGGPLALGTRIVRAPVGVLSHEPEDMTVRVLCGTPVSEMHAELAHAGQRTALPERGGTVGGAFSVGEDDVCAPGVGTVRAALLQFTSVSAEGRPVTGGGPTVKNVSGFDLPRLMVGSLGTLGPLVSVLIRTAPIPEATGWWRADDVDFRAVRKALYRPAGLLSDGATTWVHLRGHRVDVNQQIRTLAQYGVFNTVDSGPVLPPWRWSVSRADIGSWLAACSGDGVACLLTGRLWRTTPQPMLPLDPVIVTLTRRTKNLFDPAGRFNPGRDPLIEGEITDLTG